MIRSTTRVVVPGCVGLQHDREDKHTPALYSSRPPRRTHHFAISPSGILADDHSSSGAVQFLHQLALYRLRKLKPQQCLVLPEEHDAPARNPPSPHSSTATPSSPPPTHILAKMIRLPQSAHLSMIATTPMLLALDLPPLRAHS